MTSSAELFVYGTLRHASASPSAAWLREKAQWRGPAVARGTLFALDGYPGFVPDPPDGQVLGGQVLGDLFLLPADRAGRHALFAALDAYEECSPQFPEPHEYRRHIVDVQCAGETLAAWTYIYAWPVEGLARIDSGDFLAWQSSTLGLGPD